MSRIEILIDGVPYVAKSDLDENRVIIRTQNAGVHYGTIETRDGSEVCLADSRRLWFWKGAASLSQLATEGVKCPSECKFAVSVPTITLLQVIEIIPCTTQAVKCIDAVEEWRND